MLPDIAIIDAIWLRRAAEYQAKLTMPTGALGRLLELGRQLCAIQETLTPVTEPAAVLVMAGDHGVAAEGISAYPQLVTGQMVVNFQRGGAAINVIARRQGARVVVVNMGTVSSSPAQDNASDFFDRSIAPGTANFLHGPAMTSTQALQAIEAGRHIVAKELSAIRVLALGEMGIGNTTSASALTAALLGKEPRDVTGRGTGVDDAGLQRKVKVIESALRLHFPNQTAPADPLDALTKLGGFEIAGLVGAALEAGALRKLVILDGFISSVAGLIAVRLAPNLRHYIVAAHRSVEAGHRAVLEALDLAPLFDLGMRLGEGSGAALALNLIHCAADIMRDMATFEGAGVSRG